MQHFINALKGHATAMDGARPQARWGIVRSVDPNRPAVKLELQPGGALTGWCPIVLPFAGNGWTDFAVPVPGTMAWAQPDLGSNNDWVITGFAHNDQTPLPTAPNAIGANGVPSDTNVTAAPGERILMSKAGFVIRLCADGTGYLRGNLNLDGTLRVNGEIYDQHGMLDVLRQAYNTHAHGGILRGGATTDATTIPVPE